MTDQPPPPPKPGGPFDSSQVYWVTSNVDPSALVARRTGIDQGWLHWDDTNRDRQRRVQASEARPGGVVWVKTEKDVEYTFTPITVELYEEHVRTKVELSPAFESTEALVEFYRTASFG